MIASAFLNSGFEPSTTPPDAAPTNPSLYSYGGGLVGVSWVPGDNDAETEIGYFPDPNLGALGDFEPTSVTDKVAPGVSGYETGQSEQTCRWWVRHKRGGSVSAWVGVTDSSPFICTEEE